MQTTNGIKVVYKQGSGWKGGTSRIPPLYRLGTPMTCFYLGQTPDVFSTLFWGVRKADLIIADPPYGVGVKYVGFVDVWKDFNAYMDWTYRWVQSCLNYLSDIGSLWVLTPPRVAAHIRVKVEKNDIAKCYGEVIWHYRFGQCMDCKWIPSHATWLWLGNTEKPQWDPDAVLVESDRKSKYGDKRIHDSKRGGMRVPLDVWTFPRVQGNNKERQKDCPNQLPEQMIACIIRACSKKGQLILDPFVGSGTTTCVARALGRRSLGVDVCESTLKLAYERTANGTVHV